MKDRSIHGEAAYSRWRYRSVAGMRATGRSAQPHDHPRRGRPAPRDGQSPHWTAVAAVLLAALIWSTSFAVTKVTLRALPPLTIGALRFALAAIVLGVIVHARRGAVLPTVRQRVRIGLAGLLGITAYFALENFGVDFASASDATLIVASYPIITLIAELALGRVRFSAIRLLGMVVAAAGVWLVISHGRASYGRHHLLGDLILLAAGIVWAAYSMVAQQDSSGASPIVVTYYQTLAGALGFAVLSLSEASRWSAASPGMIARVVFLALFCSVAAFLSYNYGLKSLVPSVAVNLLNIVPVAGLLWAIVLAGEVLSPLQVLGGGIVIVGVSIGLFRSTREPGLTDPKEAREPADAIQLGPEVRNSDF